MKSLEQEVAKLKKFSCTKPVVDDISESISLKPKANNVYIPPLKRNQKEKAYVARLDKCKSSNVVVEVSKLVSKPTTRVQNKFVFVPTYHLCGVVGHIRSNCSLLRQKQKSETRYAVRNIDVPKFDHVFHFCGITSHIRPNYHKLKFKHSVF